MARRDPNKTARNRIIDGMKAELRRMLPAVLAAVGLNTEASLKAKIGSKTDDFLDLKNDVIHSHEEFVNRWLQGLRKEVDQGSPAYTWIYNNLRRHPSFRDYVLLFLRR